MRKVTFGTDGFRGIIADNFTFDNVRRIAGALAVYLKKKNAYSSKKGVVVGFDRRFLSRNFAESIAHELSRQGIFVLFCSSAVPTPAVSSYIRAKRLPCGVIVTASHNPPYFNGVKIKDAFGASATKIMTAEIEKLVPRIKLLKKTGRIKPGKIKNVEIIKPYVASVRKYVNLPLLKQAAFHIVVDAMHGTGASIMEKVLSDTGCRVETLRGQRDVLFGGVNPEPIIENLDCLRKRLKETECDLAVALDGDADRIGAMCPNGSFISSHKAICLLLLHFIENRKWTGKVLKSINTTTLVDKITEHYGLALEEVPVGFKNIAAKMLNEDILLGGEESGGIGFKNYMPERDGVLSGLLLLEMMASRKKGIVNIVRDMERRFGRFFYLRKDLNVRAPRAIAPHRRILNKKVLEVKTYDGTKFILEDESWLLIRASGTEPIVRIYAESRSLEMTRKLIQFGCALL